jgi:hypothetical protein
MLKTFAPVILAVLIPTAALAGPKEKGNIQVQVVSSQIKTHGAPPSEVFRYTDVMFTRVSGQNVIFECAQRGDLCPVMENGKGYAAERAGDFIYIAMTLADGKSVSVKYKQLGSW